MIKVPFNKPYATGAEFDYIREAIERGQLAGNGEFTKRCHRWLESVTGANKALLTHSCTSALEMCALLADVGPGDEVIMPSYTFVSTANAFALRGATPVFVDIREDTLDLDETLIESAITARTKAICPVHYAGVACEMEAIMALAEQHGLIVIEDAAQGAMASYRGRALGSIGHLGALSFHETKNIISGEGGALLVNDERFAERAEILWEKGTNRSAFFRGDVDKYTWMDIGSSFLPGELMASFLWAQLEQAPTITEARLATWARYHAAFDDLEAEGIVRRPIVPEGRTHNAHMYYLLVRDLEVRTRLLDALRSAGYLAVFHYVPLHSSPAGMKYGRAQGVLPETTSLSERLLRLPLWVGIEDDTVDAIVQVVQDTLTKG